MSLGKVAYEAYCGFSRGKSLVSGQELPVWRELDEVIKEAWVVAAKAVKSHIPDWYRD